MFPSTMRYQAFITSFLCPQASSNEPGMLVKQGFPVHGRAVMGQLQDPSLSKELSRIITSQGAVIRNMRDGSTEVTAPANAQLFWVEAWLFNEKPHVCCRFYLQMALSVPAMILVRYGFLTLRLRRRRSCKKLRTKRKVIVHQHRMQSRVSTF